MAYNALNRLIQRPIVTKISCTKRDPSGSEDGGMAIACKTKKAHITKKCRYFILKISKLLIEQCILNKPRHSSNISIIVRQ